MRDLADLISDHLSLRAGKPGDLVFLGGRPLGRGEMYPDGRELRRVDYLRLNACYAALGYPFGAGNGTTTFNIPDVRGRTLFGRDTMGIRGNARRMPNTGSGHAAIDATRVGRAGGVDRFVLSIDNLPFNALTLQNIAAKTTIQTGKFTDTTGGTQLYASTALSSAISIVQPSMVFDCAIILGQDEVVVQPAPEPGTGTSDLKFFGPYNDWLNVVDFGADPTGTEDSTDAFIDFIHAVVNQEQIGSSADFSTFYNCAAGYIPEGTYLISRTLYLPDKEEGDTAGAYATRLVGADPRTTILKWVGDTDGTVMWAVGWHDGCLSRLTLDGNNTAGTLFRLERDTDIALNQSFNRLEDCIFKDALRGIENSNVLPGWGTDSELDIMRCRFYRLAEYGVVATAPEAYDYWVRSSYFEACGVGVGRIMDPQYLDFTDHTAFDVLNAGQFSVVDGRFNGSLVVDIDAAQGDNILIARNVSTNSNRFARLLAANLTFLANRVVDPIQTDCVQLISQYGALPNGILAFNEFKLRGDATGGVIVHLFNAGEDVYRLTGDARNNDPRYTNHRVNYIGNKFSVAYEGVISLDIYYTGARFRDSQFVDGTLIGQTIADDGGLICPVPPQSAAQVFYFTNPPINGRSTIDSAAAFKGSNPGADVVMYLPFFADSARNSVGGTTWEFPASVRMHFEGAHSRTWLHWGSNDDANDDVPLAVFRGPSLISCSHITCPSFNQGSKSGLQIVYDNCDQVGGRLYSEGCLGSYLLNGTANLMAHAVNLNLFVNPGSNGYADAGVQVFGDAGAVQTGGLNIELGTGSILTTDPSTMALFHVKDGGRLWVSGYWNETSVDKQISFKLEGDAQSGFVAIHCSRFRPGDGHGPTEGNWSDIRQMTVDGWMGYLITGSSAIVGRATLTGDLSNFTWHNWTSGLTAFDDGGYFYEFMSTPIKVLGKVYHLTDDELDHTMLPGYPDAYGGDDGDAYYTLTKGHLWVWHTGEWHDIGGIVMTVQAVADLPAGHTGPTLDCAFVSETSHIWQWDGDSWENLADGSAPLPVVYFRSEGPYNGVEDQSQTWSVYPWYSTPPVGENIDPPGDYVDKLHLAFDIAPPMFLQPLASGLTDARHHRFNATVTFVPGTFTIPPP